MENWKKIWFKNTFSCRYSFLFQRGLGTGLTIYAPAIILSVYGWNLTYMNIVIGVLVIIYTFSVGQKPSTLLKKQQMFVINVMFITFFLIFYVSTQRYDLYQCLTYRWCKW
jgi:Ca2+/Na+ antiporter